MQPIPPLRRVTARMELRPLEPSDEQAWVRALLQSARDWAPWTPAVNPALTPEERFQRELRRGRSGAEAGTHLRMGGFAADGAMVGLFALNEIVRGVAHSAHAAWQVSSEWVGRGFGAEGARGILDLGFAQPPDGLGLHRVQAGIMPANARSLRIAEKVGFRREGVARAYLKIAGQWEDHVLYAVLAEEWPTRG
jgi:ribosomal-protein-alanine N-acetyltransferase